MTTAYAPVCAGTTAIGALQVASTGLATSGFILTSTGAASLPSFQANAAISTLDGDSGTASGATVTVKAGVSTLHCGSSVSITGDNVSTLTLNVTDSQTNTIIGQGSGSAALVPNSGRNNAVLGYNCLSSGTTDANCVAIGSSALNLLQGSNGSNVAIGTNSLDQIVTGNTNIAINGGTLYTSSESSNILFNHPGSVGESHVLRIGGSTGSSPAALSKAFICGIQGVNVGSTATVVTAVTNQLGTAVITGGTGISIGTGANTITINNTGGGFTWNDVTSGSATMAAQNGYIADKSTLTTFTLPNPSVKGDTIKIVGYGSGGWTIVYGTNQRIFFGSSTTTLTTGSLSSTNQRDCVELVCVDQNPAGFTVVSSIGNLTVV
jgi:hypothetical protein